MLDSSVKRTSRRQLIRAALGAGAAIAAGALVAACAPAAPPTVTPAPKAPEPAKPAAAAVPTATPAPAAKGPVNLALMNVLFYTAELDKKTFGTAYETFSKQNNGQITVKETILPENAQLYTKILTTIAGGTPPDLAYIHPGRGVPMFVQANAIVALDPYIQADKTLNFDDMYKGSLSYYQQPIGSPGAKTYGLPFYSGPRIYVYNKNVFAKYGEKTPDQYEKEGNWTWDTMRDVAVRLTKGTGMDKTFGYLATTSDLTVLYPIIWSFGGDVWDATLDKTLLDQPLAEQACDYEASLQYKHAVTPGAAEMEGLPGGFLTGRIGIRAAIKQNIVDITNAWKQGKLDPVVVPIPKGPKGRFIRNGPNSFCVLTASQKRDEAYKLIAFLTQKEFQEPWLQIGGSTPVRKSMLNSDAFTKSLQPWEDPKIYAEAADLDKPLPVPTTFVDINSAFGAEFDLVRLGKQTYKEAAAKFVPKINALLKQAKEA